MKKTLLTLAAVVGLATAAQAQLSITNFGSPVETSFSGWAGTLPLGFGVSGPSAATTYRGATVGTTGGLYSINGFDFQASSSASALTLTGSFTNNTGSVISGLSVSYDAFTVVDRSSRVPSWTVTTSLADVDTSSLTWSYGDGDATMSALLTGLDIGVGETFTFSWSTDRGAGSASTPMIGIDNLSLTAVPEPHEYALAMAGLLVTVVVMRRRRAQRA